MGFSGGGSNVLKPHKHSSAVQDGSPLNMNNVTEATLNAGDIVYSDGAALQRLAIGSTAEALVVSAGVPTWGAATSNPLIKVSKTFADIVAATTSMEIYTLPQDAALCNVYTDITTVFDISTAVTIGDAGDDNGFQEATDWTAGTGLTDATRGAYVTTFKTMRSTSGTTTISAYNFSTTGGTGTTFSQLLADDALSLQASGRQELAQQFNAGHVLVGENIGSVSWWLKRSGSATGTVRCYIRQADGTEIQESSTTVDASTIPVTSTEYAFAFPETALSATDMITVSGTDVATTSVNPQTQTTEMTNGKLYETTSTGSNYVQKVANEMKMTVEYALTPVASDTQGVVDFYLQVVD